MALLASILPRLSASCSSELERRMSNSINSVGGGDTEQAISKSCIKEFAYAKAVFDLDYKQQQAREKESTPPPTRNNNMDAATRERIATKSMMSGGGVKQRATDDSSSDGFLLPFISLIIVAAAGELSARKNLVN